MAGEAVVGSYSYRDQVRNKSFASLDKSELKVILADIESNIFTGGLAHSVLYC